MLAGPTVQMHTSSPSKSSPFSWFLQLRLFAFFGMLTVVLGSAYGLNLSLPIGALCSALLIIPITQYLYLHLYLRYQNDLNAHLRESVGVGSLLLVDVGVLTLLLYLSGGPTNPFSLLYLVHVVLSAVLLGSRWAWAVAGVSSGCFGLLFFFHTPIHELHAMDHAHGLSLHLKGMFFSYLLVAALIAYFLSKILSELRASERRISLLAESQQRLASLTTLSASAAHDLGTPLASIALVTHELLRLADRADTLPSRAVREDLELLSGEVARCSEIIDELCSSSGSISGDSTTLSSLVQFIGEVRDRMNHDAARVVVTEIPSQSCYLQKRPLMVALKALLRNALESMPHGCSTPVTLTVQLDSDRVKFIIADRGCGISPEMLERIREPFFTLKEEGQGMGLGVYLADMVATQLGGVLEYRSELGRGTVATLSIPIALSKQRRAA